LSFIVSNLPCFGVAKQLEKRGSIVEEILSTERNFVTKLGLVMTYFLKPLSENADSSAPFISRTNLRAIFSELTVIQGLNDVLLQSLEKAVENASPMYSARVGGVFLKVGSFLRWYHSYVSNYDNAFTTLKSLKQRSASFRSFLSSTESKPEIGYTDLESLLILPIQRIPQYNLLMNDLAKVTTEAHPDYADVNAALTLLNQIGSYINEKKRESENIHRVIGIGKKLVGFPNLAVPYRRFVREAPMFTLPESGSPFPVMLFAFNDVLLVTQETEPHTYNVMHYAYWDRVALNSPDFSPTSTSHPNSHSSVDTATTMTATTNTTATTTTTTTTATSNGNENPLAFVVRLKESNYTFVASTPEERRDWSTLVKDHVEHSKRKATEMQVAFALKKRLQSIHSNTSQSSSASLQLRALGVLARTMLHEETSDQHTAPILSPRTNVIASSLLSSSASATATPPILGITVSGSSAAAAASSSSSTSSSPVSGNPLVHSNAAIGAGGGSGLFNVLGGSSSIVFPIPSNPSSALLSTAIASTYNASMRMQAQEEKLKSKRTRESIEIEVKSILYKEGVKDGSIDEFLSSQRVEASYIVPIVLVSSSSANSNKSSINNTSALLALSHSAFFIFFKSKLQSSGFLYDIKEISSKDHPDFTLRMNDGASYECRSTFCDDIIYQIRRAYLLTYYGIPDVYAWPIHTDDWRQPKIAFEEEKRGSFGHFVRTYRAACAYLSIPLREDVIWDITHNPTNSVPFSEADLYSYAELNLSNIEEMTNADLKTIMLALRFNPFFTSLVIRDVILSRDGFSAISDMLKYNYTVKRLVLVNNSLGKEHVSMLNESFNTQPAASNRKLEVLEIRDNNIEIVPFLTKYLDANRKFIALSHLDLSNTGLNAKAVTSLFATLRKSTHTYHTLTSLKLSGCKFDAEASSAAATFLATPCAIQLLDVSDTGIRLVQVLEAMTRGCIYLATLNISKNKWDKKLEPLLVKFLTGTDSLIALHLNATGIGAESLSHLIESASSNVYLTNLKLSADENGLGALGGSMLSKSLKDTKGIVELSLADNDFGDEGLNAIFQTLSSSGTSSIRRLVLDANFKMKTTKSRASMMRSLIKLTSSKNCKLTHLSIAGISTTTQLLASNLSPGGSASSSGAIGSRYAGASSSSSRTSTQLRTDLIPFLDSLPRFRVAELNISGHRMGPRGILALGRALQESTHVKKIWWDENGTTAESFASIVHATHSNTSLIVFPAPLVDLASILTQGDSIVNAKIIKHVEDLSVHIAQNASAASTSAASQPKKSKKSVSSGANNIGGIEVNHTPANTQQQGEVQATSTATTIASSTAVTPRTQAFTQSEANSPRDVLTGGEPVGSSSAQVPRRRAETARAKLATREPAQVLLPPVTSKSSSSKKDRDKASSETKESTVTSTKPTSGKLRDLPLSGAQKVKNAGPNSARGPGESSTKATSKSKNYRTPRGSASTADQQAPSSTSTKPKADQVHIKDVSASSSTTPSTATSLPESLSPLGETSFLSPDAHAAPTSGKLRHLRLPSNNSSPDIMTRAVEGVVQDDAVNLPSPAADLSSSRPAPDFWHLKRDLSHSASKMSAATADVITGVSPRPGDPSTSALLQLTSVNPSVATLTAVGSDSAIATAAASSSSSARDATGSGASGGDSSRRRDSTASSASNPSVATAPGDAATSDEDEDDDEQNEYDEILELDESYDEEEDTDYVARTPADATTASTAATTAVATRTNEKEDDDAEESTSKNSHYRKDDDEEEEEEDDEEDHNHHQHQDDDGPHQHRHHHLHHHHRHHQQQRSPRSTDNLRRDTPADELIVVHWEPQQGPQQVDSQQQQSQQAPLQQPQHRTRPPLERASTSFVRLKIAVESLPSDIDFGSYSDDESVDDLTSSSSENQSSGEGTESSGVRNPGNTTTTTTTTTKDEDEKDSRHEESSREEYVENEDGDVEHEDHHAKEAESDEFAVVDAFTLHRETLRRSVALEYGAQLLELSSGDSDSEVEATGADTDEDYDDVRVDRSAFDHLPTLPPMTGGASEQANSSSSTHAMPQDFLVSRAVSVLNVGAFEHAPTLPPMMSHQSGTTASEPIVETEEEEPTNNTTPRLTASFNDHQEPSHGESGTKLSSDPSHSTEATAATAATQSSPVEAAEQKPSSISPATSPSHQHKRKKKKR